MISGKVNGPGTAYKAKAQTELVRMDYRLYDMSDPHSDIGVSLWGPGQALCFKTNMTTSASCSTPTTPSYSQSLDLETRMLDGSTMPMIGSTMVSIPAHVPPLHTVISGPAADCRHAVCPSVRPEMQIPTTLSGLPRTSTSGKTKMRGRTEDPCQIAPLKKRKIQLEMLSPDQRDRVIQKREKNKVAAEKCRVKRRERNQEIRAQYEDYLEANEELESQIRKLREEHRILQELLENHSCVMQKTCKT